MLLSWSEPVMAHWERASWYLARRSGAISRRRNAAASSSVSRVLDVVTGFAPAVNAPIMVGAVPAPYSSDEAALRTRSSALAAAAAEMGAIMAVALTIHGASAGS